MASLALAGPAAIKNAPALFACAQVFSGGLRKPELSDAELQSEAAVAAQAGWQVVGADALAAFCLALGK